MSLTYLQNVASEKQRELREIEEKIRIHQELPQLEDLSRRILSLELTIKETAECQIKNPHMIFNKRQPDEWVTAMHCYADRKAELECAKLEYKLLKAILQK